MLIGAALCLYAGWLVIKPAQAANNYAAEQAQALADAIETRVQKAQVIQSQQPQQTQQAVIPADEELVV